MPEQQRMVRGAILQNEYKNTFNITRRTALKLLPGALGCATYPDMMRSAHAEAVNSAGGLAALAAQRGLLFGSAMTAREFAPAFASLFISETAIITAENEMKMAIIRENKDATDFTRADALCNFALKQGKLLRGHTLVWNSWVPEWIKTLSKPEMERFLDEHIELVVGRYEGRIHSWDVVNEAVGNEPFGPLTLRKGPFTDIVGPDYIARSFRRARAFDPKAKLILNETHTERDDAFGVSYRKRLLVLIDSLLDAGVPLDGIGLQGHIEPDVKFIPESYAEFLQAIADRGLEIQITELDVNDESFPDDIEQRDIMVAEVYSRFLQAALANRNVKLVATWQMFDRASFYHRDWLEKFPSAERRPRPLLFDLQLNKKPSYFAVAEAFKNMPSRS
jgi:endo-1,4-beta-xylanase